MTIKPEEKAVVLDLAGNLGGCLFDLVTTFVQPWETSTEVARKRFVESAKILGGSIVQFVERMDDLHGN